MDDIDELNKLKSLLHKKYNDVRERIRIDAEISNGNTKIARLITNRLIELRWKAYIDYSIHLRKYLSKTAGGKGVPDGVIISDSEGTFDEPYKLWLKNTEVVITNRHIYSKDSSNEERDMNYDNLKAMKELSF